MAAKSKDANSGPHATRSATETQALKDHLFQRAATGEITGEEADAEAERLGIGRLSSKPDPADFDPGRQAHWTLPMTVAWIAYRRIDAVRGAWSEYCAEYWHWIWRRYRVGFDGPIREGWHLEPRHRPTLVGLRLGAIVDELADDSPPKLSIKEAEESLWCCLSEGMIRATGIGLESGKRAEIAAVEWIELKPFETENGCDEVRLGPFGTGYRQVELPSKGVRLIWGEPKPPVSLPDVKPPEGDGHMPLFFAALWIATAGGTIGFDPQEESIWQHAFAELLAAIASEKVRVIGTNEGSRLPVPAYLFADCAVDYPYADASMDLMISEELYLRSYPYVDEERWRRGFDDSLINRYGNHWSRLIVSKEDMRARWSFHLPTMHASGAPGRPSSMQLVLDKLEKRALACLEANVTAEAEHLARWLAATHPTAPKLTAKTIRNKIASRFRELRAAQK
jgi:hypothetical protein